MALTLLATNNAESALASAISATDTSLIVSAGTGAEFPDAVAGESYFKLTLTDAATGSQVEIVNVTAKAGDIFIIERAQEGTLARAWAANDMVANMMTADTLNVIADYSKQAADSAEEAKGYALSASEFGDNKFTFYKTSSDPDGTIAGLAATTTGQSFRVAQGVDGTDAFITYQNDNGVAVAQAAQPGTAAISGTIREFPTLAAAQADADAGNIPNGSTAYYRIPDDSALAMEVINNGGALESTGRKIPSQAGVDASKKIALTQEFNETDFRRANFDGNYLWRGHIHEFTPFISQHPVAVQVTDFSSNNSSTVAGKVGIYLDGVLQSIIYLPRAGARYIDGKLYSSFSKFTLADCEKYRVAQSDANIVRFQFTVPESIMKQAAVADSVHGYYDLSGKFSPMSVNEITSATDYAIASTAVLNVFQVTLKTADITSAGYDYTIESDVEEFVRLMARTCMFMGYTGVYKVTNGVEGYFSRWVNPGLISVSPISGSEAQVSRITILGRLDKPLARVNRLLYQSADVKNSSGYALNKFPVEIKVNFPQGEVHPNTRIKVTNSSGDEINAQFSPEWYPNPQSCANQGYYSDGSLSSGSVFISDSMGVGGQKFYELKAFSGPDVITDEKPLVTPKPAGLSVGFGGYIYDFTSFGGLGSITTPQGKTFAVQVQSWTSGIDSGVITDKLSNIQFTQRIVSNGSVFIEVEQICYNPSYTSMAAYSIRHTTRYRIFKNGKIYIRFVHHAATDIPVNSICGVSHRLIMPSTKLTIDEERFYSGHYTDADTGNIISISLMRSTWDTHRDGTTYGPTRPGYFYAGNPSSTATRIMGGWKTTALNDYSLLNWPVTKDYCWTGEGFIDFETELSTSKDIITSLYSRPVGRFGHPCWPSSVRERLFRRFDDFCSGSMEWFNSFAASPYQGGTSNTKYYQSYTWDIYQYLTKGIGSLEDIYTRFKFRCDNSFGGFSAMGSGYLTGKLLLQFSSRLVVPVYEWLYRAAVRENNSDIVSSLKTSIASYADGIVSRFNTSGGCPLNGSQNGVGNSNSNATAMRVLSLAIFMGVDVTGNYQTALNGLNSLLSGARFNYITGVLSDEAYSAKTPSNWLVQANWLHYQAYVANNYLMACDAIGRAPSFDMVSYLMQAQTGFGGFEDSFYCISESRRGSFNTYTFAMYPLIRAGTASAICAAEALWDQVEAQHTAIVGMTKRMYDFDGNTASGDARYEVSFNATVLADCMLKFWFDARS